MCIQCALLTGRRLGEVCTLLMDRIDREQKYASFIQTALREWACAAAYPNSSERVRELPRRLHEYNLYRNHSALQNKQPISRVGEVVNNVLQLHN